MNFKKINSKIESMIFKCDTVSVDGLDLNIYNEKLLNFCEFFDTARLNFNETYNFVFNEENEHTKILNYLIEKLALNNEEREELEYFIGTCKEESNGHNYFNDYFKSNISARQLFRNVVKAMLWLSFWTEKAMIKTKILYDDLEFYKYCKRVNNNYYFRGQSNYLWNLNPSFLRDFQFFEDDGCVIDNKVLFNIYKEAGLIDKYNEAICDNKEIKDEKGIDYEFLSFMQHAISYSPLIDFTSDIDIACQFAFCKSEPNTFSQKDSSIFVLHNVKEKVSEDNDAIDFKIYFLNKKIKPGTVMNIKKSDGGDKEIDFTTISKIKDKLTPKFKIFKKMTNDRMKYQKGLFVLFYDYVSVKGKVYYLFNDEFYLLKKRISTKSKNEILSNLSSRTNMSYLMNPYLYFND